MRSPDVVKCLEETVIKGAGRASSALVLLLFLGGALVSGCKGVPDEACAETCVNGTACNEDTGLCEVVPLSLYTGMLPGRSIELTIDGERLFGAVIEPQQGLLLVGHIGRSEQEFRILEELEGAANKRLSAAASTRRVAVAWLGSDRRYRLAMRPTGASNLEWTTIDVVPGPEETSGYEGSEDFALAIDELGRIHLVFFDSQRRALRRLHTTTTSGVWQIEDVDDGMTPLPLAGCSVERRQVLRRGVGLEPDLLVQEETLFVAYHDADCGDLRLARRGEERWVVSVVDNGEYFEEGSRAQERGVVGKFPSIAANSRGQIGIAYHDVSRGRVLYVRAREGEFIREVADGGVELDAFGQERKQLVGAFTQLIYDRDDTARLVYMNGTLNTLRRAHRQAEADGSSRWLYRRLDEPGPVGFFAQLLLHPQLGKIIASERLGVGGSQGLGSELVLVWEER